MSPIIQTPDQRQWIDLELLNPKFLKGLNEYACSIGMSRTARLAKALHGSRHGCDTAKLASTFASAVRSTRTRTRSPTFVWFQTCVIRESKPSTEGRNKAELPETCSIAGLADTAATRSAELDASQNQLSRASTISTEPLPRYGRLPGSAMTHLDDLDSATPSKENSDEYRDFPMTTDDVQHRPSLS